MRDRCGVLVTPVGEREGADRAFMVPARFLFCLNRLQYFARGLQVYIRQLRVALQGKTGDALKTEEVNER